MNYRSNMPPIRNCPVCAIAMSATKSDAALAEFDTFSCLNCGSVVSLVPQQKNNSTKHEK
jgi:hypothetical protein